MEKLTFAELKHDLNNFVMSGEEKFAKYYKGIYDTTVEIVAYNDGDSFDFYCFISLICRVSKESNHVSVAFLNEVVRQYGAQ